MKDFKFYTPTEVVFGADSEQQVAALVKKHGGHKVLLHYGGQSAVQSGLLDSVQRMLTEAGIPYAQLGGVVPNPLLSKVTEGIELVRRELVDFILAIGGGSVIDSAKAIGYGVCCNGRVWEILEGQLQPTACLPIGAILTIPAAGSEMSSACVITKDDGMLKRSYSNDLCRCRFAIMNPVRTFTLPPYQTAAGVVDIMMHTMERYFSIDPHRELTDAIAEALMRTMFYVGPRLLAEPENYDLRADVMWAGSLAHNDITGDRQLGDWATHQIEHELSALYGATHGAGLAAIWPHWAAYVLPFAPRRFARFATNVLGVEPQADDTVTALAGINEMCRFYHSLSMPTSIPELIGRRATQAEMEEMAEKCSRSHTLLQGKVRPLTYDDILNIYVAANA